MQRLRTRPAFLPAAACALLCGSVICGTVSLAQPAPLEPLPVGKAALQSAGPIAFGPEGILFVGDWLGARVWALDTREGAPGGADASGDQVDIHVEGVNRTVAGLLGIASDQVIINDLAVAPASQNAYLSVTRGRGEAAAPALAKVGRDGEVSLLNLDEIGFAVLELPHPVPMGRDRADVITALTWSQGLLWIAGLSQDGAASGLTSGITMVPFPFPEPEEAGEVSVAPLTAAIEFYHGFHARYETADPVRAFTLLALQPEDSGETAQDADLQEFLLAAYTDTPLVRIPVLELAPGTRAVGTTIAQLGAGNRPLDLIAYRKDGRGYLLLANSSRGVMRIPADGLASQEAIVEPVILGGAPFETLSSWSGVRQLVKLNETSALLLGGNTGSLDLYTVPLP